MNLVQAEILKLRRRRGLMAWTALLTLGPVLIGYGVLVAMHLANGTRYGPAGGTENLDNVLGVLAGIGLIGAIVLGTTAGSQDISSGVFRDLVITGRPRPALFRARVGGALGVFAPLFAAAFGLAVAASYAFAGGTATPSLHRVGQDAVWLIANMLLTTILAVSLSSIISSKVATGVLVAWNSVLAGFLGDIGALGSARKAIGNVAMEHFLPATESAAKVPMSNVTAVVVLAVWMAVALRAGAFATTRRDA